MCFENGLNLTNVWAQNLGLMTRQAEFGQSLAQPYPSHKHSYSAASAARGATWAGPKQNLHGPNQQKVIFGLGLFWFRLYLGVDMNCACKSGRIWVKL